MEIDFSARMQIRRFNRRIMRMERERLRELEKQRKFAEMTNFMLEPTYINRTIVKMLDIGIGVFIGTFVGTTGGAWFVMPFRFKDVKIAALRVVLETLLVARIRLQKEDTQ